MFGRRSSFLSWGLLVCCCLGLTPIRAFSFECSFGALVRGAKNAFKPTRGALLWEYDAEFAYWKDELAKSGVNPEKLVALTQESDHHSLESWLALADALTPNAPQSLRSQLERLKNEGMTIQFKKVIPGKAPVELSLDKHKLTITIPETPPKNAKDLFETMVGISLAMNKPDIRKTGRAPLLSWPVGQGPNAYPTKLAQALSAPDMKIYHLVFSWAERFGTPPVELPGPGDGGWRTVLRLPFSLLFPARLSFKNHRPDENGYRAFLDGNRNGDPTKAVVDYNRDRLYWEAAFNTAMSRYQDAIRLTVLAGLAKTAWGTYQLFSDDDRRKALLANVNLFYKLATDRKFRAKWYRKAKEDYEAHPEGHPAVNSTYNKLIAADRKDIELHGDPDGSLQADIDDLIEKRDKVNH